MNTEVFDRSCRDCARLATFLDAVKARYPDYYCRPVPPFGAADARLLIVGLAPGMHGANRTGRPFTGDHAGILLYRMLHKHGFSSRDQSEAADDGLRLIDCRITNAVKCLPPENKPVGAEINECNRFLAGELALLPAGAVVLALGGIGHRAVIKAVLVGDRDAYETLVDRYQGRIYNALLWMCGANADEFLGQEISLRDEAIRKRVGLI